MKQEPVAWKCVAPPCKCDSTNFKQCCYANYTAPRELSDDEIEEVIDSITKQGHGNWNIVDVCKAILKKASEK